MTEAGQRAQQEAFIELARRPGAMLMVCVLWPSAVTAGIGAWAIAHLAGIADALLVGCGR